MKLTIHEAKSEDARSIVRLICKLAETTEETTPITEAYVTKYLSSLVSEVL